jgi:hypothetical protein
MKLTNKVALITGGNSGIGFATARFVCGRRRSGRSAPPSWQKRTKPFGNAWMGLPRPGKDASARIVAMQHQVQSATKSLLSNR